MHSKGSERYVYDVISLSVKLYILRNSSLGCIEDLHDLRPHIFFLALGFNISLSLQIPIWKHIILDSLMGFVTQFPFSPMLLACLEDPSIIVH